MWRWNSWPRISASPTAENLETGSRFTKGSNNNDSFSTVTIIFSTVTMKISMVTTWCNDKITCDEPWLSCFQKHFLGQSSPWSTRGWIESADESFIHSVCYRNQWFVSIWICLERNVNLLGSFKCLESCHWLDEWTWFKAPNTVNWHFV